MDPYAWPLKNLRLRTPRLELRWPTPGDLEELAELTAAGVHDPATQPFRVPWTDAPASERPHNTLQFFWGIWGAWKPTDWHLEMVVVRDGVVVGVQSVRGENFAIMREVVTGSWLGLAYQGEGIGTEMRAAVLSLAFDGLDAEFAISTANLDNTASLRVSRKLGYAENGTERCLVRGIPVTQQRFLMDRETWRARRPVTAEITGLEPCLPMFGLLT